MNGAASVRPSFFVSEEEMEQYRKNLLEQLRLCVIDEKKLPVSDGSLVKAVTVNEELRRLGYSLSAADVVRLAGSESLDGFYTDFVPLLGDVKAAPMYPGFPKEVMEMDEALFRFHQLCHYTSTYGVEELARMMGVEHKVTRGWLPETEAAERTEEDSALLEAKTVKLISRGEMYSLPLETLLKKPEKLTIRETDIVREALAHTDIASLDLDIPFKKNMMPVFYALFCLEDRDAALSAMRRLCSHTGDVLKCADYTLTRCDYHLRSSQKKLIVKLIESYPPEDWKANVILSGKKARRAILVLQYLSYSRFSRSEEHMETVRMLRNGELRSWEGQAKALLYKKDEGAIDFIAKRPGMLLRWTNWLLKLGYEEETVGKRLYENSESLSAKTLAFALTQLGRLDGKEKAFDLLLKVFCMKMRRADTPLKGKSVFVDGGRLDLEHSMLLSKGDEAGYVRNGLAYRIPEGVRYVRFFVYWNDRERVDIDLHCSAIGTDGTEYDIGWNADFRNRAAVHSGDITHSDAAEYIDVDLDADISEVQLNINLFDGKANFGLVDECFAGMMAVSAMASKVKLYDPKNCFFQSDMRSRTRTVDYGYINVQKRYLCLDSDVPRVQGTEGAYELAEHRTSSFSLGRYIGLLLDAQGSVRVDKKEDADVVLVMEKCENDGEISLIDSDFFLG